jgi:DNA-3-methyladenine glycosylase II
MHSTFTQQNFHSLCDQLAKKDKHLRSVIKQYGYPPVWTRKASFQTLVHIILEQQVSLASARSALNKLKGKLGRVTPKKLLALSDQELKACHFSRQKTAYVRCLAQTIVSGEIRLKELADLDDSVVRQRLKKIKGVGDWTVDVYLLFVLQRANVFPVGDLAMVNALREVKGLTKQIKHDELLMLAQDWQPYRSIATMLLWHYYLRKRGMKS